MFVINLQNIWNCSNYLSNNKAAQKTIKMFKNNLTVNKNKKTNENINSNCWKSITIKY